MLTFCIDGAKHYQIKCLLCLYVANNMILLSMNTKPSKNFLQSDTDCVCVCVCVLNLGHMFRIEQQLTSFSVTYFSHMV
jgi:hypothetical protein